MSLIGRAMNYFREIRWMRSAADAYREQHRQKVAKFVVDVQDFTQDQLDAATVCLGQMRKTEIDKLKLKGSVK